MKLEELVEQFAQHVQAESEAGWQGDAKAANRHVDEYLAVFDELARAVLEEAAKGKGVVPFEAQQALKRWEEGTWALDPA